MEVPWDDGQKVISTLPDLPIKQDLVGALVSKAPEDPEGTSL